MGAVTRDEMLQILQDLGGDNAYGVTIRAEIKSRYGRDVAYGALYALLWDMEAEGLVGSYEMPGGQERRYRPKRCWYVRRLGAMR